MRFSASYSSRYSHLEIPTAPLRSETPSSRPTSSTYDLTTSPLPPPPPLHLVIRIILWRLPRSSQDIFPLFCHCSMRIQAITSPGRRVPYSSPPSSSISLAGWIAHGYIFRPETRWKNAHVLEPLEACLGWKNRREELIILLEIWTGFWEYTKFMGEVS